MLPRALTQLTALTLAGLCVLSAATARAEDKPETKDVGQRVDLKDCPEAVQKTIQKEAGDATIVLIIKDTYEGELDEYTVITKRGEKNRNLFIKADGKLLVWEEPVALKDCPAVVQKTITDKTGSAAVTEIIRSVQTGSPDEFIVTLKQGDKLREFSVDGDGKFLGWYDEERQK